MRGTEFLPVSREEMLQRDWYYYDFLVVTADAYIDHPSFGTTLIARMLEGEGYRVAILAQPDWRSAAPFAALGFFTYHGMTAEQVLWAWFKSEILCPKRLVFKSDSYYYEAMQPAIRAGMKRKRGKPMKKNTHDSEETA